MCKLYIGPVDAKAIVIADIYRYVEGLGRVDEILSIKLETEFQLLQAQVLNVDLQAIVIDGVDHEI